MNLKAYEPLSIENRKQLFIDKRFIQDSEDVSLTMNPPYMGEDPVLIPDRPWEVRIGGYNTAVSYTHLTLPTILRV